MGNQITNQKTEIFLSYAWGEEREEIVNKLYNTFLAKDYNVIRDKIDLGYKESITDFMNKIGNGNIVVIVISDKYLKSPNCMYEMLQILKNGNFADRIFPIVLGDANIYDPNNRLKYINYWQDKFSVLNENLKNVVDQTVIADEQKELRSYREILDMIGNILIVLKDMNTLTPEMHNDSDFAVLFSAIDLLIDKDKETDNLSGNPDFQSLSDTQLFDLKQLISGQHKDLITEITRFQNQNDQIILDQNTETLLNGLDDFLKEIKMMEVDGIKNRLITTYKLLREYEDLIILEDDPRRKMRYENDIKVCKGTIEKAKLELKATIKQQ